MSSASSALTWVAIAGLFASCLGCGQSGPNMGQVTGRVTVDGNIVAEGTVQFWPENGRPSRGTIKDGIYELTTFEPNDGALAGDHRVTIKATKLSGAAPTMDSTAAEIAHFSQRDVKKIRASRVLWVVPEKYSDVGTSTLAATVKPGSNEINFDIEED